MFSKRKAAATTTTSSYQTNSNVCKSSFSSASKVSLLLLSLLCCCCCFSYLSGIVDFKLQHALQPALAWTIDLNKPPEDAADYEEAATAGEGEVEVGGEAEVDWSEPVDNVSVLEIKTNDGKETSKQTGDGQQQQQQQQCDDSKPPSNWFERIKCQASNALKTSQCTLSQLPKYFDFDDFKKKFKRKYSQTEYLFRKSIFLKRCFQIFKSRLAYRLGLTSYIQGVNKFSDRSNNEMKLMLMSGPPIEFWNYHQSDDGGNKSSKEEYLEKIKESIKEREEIEKAGLFAEFESQSSLSSMNNNLDDTNELEFVNFSDFLPLLNNNNNNNYNEEGESTNNDEQQQQQQQEQQSSATTIINECKLKKKIQLAMANIKDEELLKAIQDEIDDLKIETFSQSSLIDDGCETKRSPKLYKQYSRIVDDYDDNELDDDGDNSKDVSLSSDDNNNNNSIANKLLFNLDLNKLEEGQNDDEAGRKLKGIKTTNSESAAAHYEIPQLRDKCDSLDWSNHECFHQIYDQGTNCGKCYVMASTSLAEFYKCNENGDENLEKRKFSKEYIFNCAQKYSPTTILGCSGGSLLDTLKFISISGVYNIRGWKLKSENELKRLKSIGNILSKLDLNCPLNQYELPFNSWGQIKLSIKPLIVKTNQWFNMIKYGPIVVSIQMPPVETYESGVHDGLGCEASGNWHSMLLVGYGMNEQGIAYWKFRNSWGKNWGEQGHFKLAMSVSGKCLAGGVRVVYSSDSDS